LGSRRDGNDLARLQKKQMIKVTMQCACFFNTKIVKYGRSYFLVSKNKRNVRKEMRFNGSHGLKNPNIELMGFINSAVTATFISLSFTTGAI
jgi:hypothetical protein